MSERAIDVAKNRPTAEYLVRSRDYRVSETFSIRDARYQEVDKLLGGDWGYKLPGDNIIVEKPMVMNLGLTFSNDVSRLVTEQTPVYKSPVYGDKKADSEAAEVREVVAETLFIENRGDLFVPQFAIDLAVCGAAYTVAWADEESDYPQYTRVDPRHAYPNIHNGKLLDLLIIQVFPAAVADAMFPGYGIYEDSQNKNYNSDVEIWEYYAPGYSCRYVAHGNKGGSFDPSVAKLIDEYTFGNPKFLAASYTQIPSHDGGIRGMLDQLGDSLMAKNKIASLMTKYTEHKVFASWEAKGILNPKDTPGPNTVYLHDENAPGDTFIRRVEPAGSDPALFALMNLMDSDQRGGIGYPMSRQGEVSQSIASAAFVESTQGQLSSIVKNLQAHEADLRGQTIEKMMYLDKTSLDFEKPLYQAINKKRTYLPSKDLGERPRVRVLYGAGAGMSRQNADNRILNLLGARLIDRGTARDNVEFLRDRADIQDKIEMENAEDALQQLFWPDPNVPIDAKFAVKKLMTDQGINLTEAWDRVQADIKAKAEAAAQEQAAQQAPEQAPPAEQMPMTQQGGPADQQALALEKGQQVQQPADIQLPPSPMEQIFVGN